MTKVMHMRSAWLGIMCGMVASATMAMDTPPPQPSAIPTRSVIITKPNGASQKLLLEMADTPAQQETGLMYRKQLDVKSGMVFNFANCSHHAMWMKNTYIPLDMLFIDCKGNIAAIVPNTTPYSEAIIAPATESIAVIELNAGATAKLGIDIGDSVLIQQPITP